MSSSPGREPSDGARLRRRQPAAATSSPPSDNGLRLGSHSGSQPPLPGRDPAATDGLVAPASKTFGRTSDGIVFVVPTTHDMVSQLLHPGQPKNLSDFIVLAILALHIFAACLLPSAWRRPAFAMAFLWWRASYNIGIGLLLHVQSRHRRLITWARRWRLFEDPATGRNPRPWLYRLLKREFEAKIPQDYCFASAPIEYNIWLIFRRLVDLILMCDFVSYCLFAVAWGHTPKGESLPMGVARWALGVALVGFNLWVKLDAHRVVKDFAWYWGDFFFLVDQDLTFDGVFEMAPHPMYSIGYAGYYGISMMAASYEVLFISIFAHVAQFIFLVAVENPHIEKTYNPPPPRRRTPSLAQADPSLLLTGATDDGPADRPLGSSLSMAQSPAAVHDMVGFSNMDLFRVPDCVIVIVPLYLAVLTLVTPSTPLWQAAFVAHALLWRVWYHLGLGLILDRQSKRKMWTRHFLKFGEGAGEAWRQWKGILHISMIMCNAAMISACWKMYAVPDDWRSGLVLLKHVLGASLVALHVWTAFSVYQSLGEFGWFCGDFFDHEVKLTYTSIYRFLNNPERIFGTAGVWGAALITWSRPIFIMAIITQILSLYYLSFIERPHMQKIYGRSLRMEAGLTKFIRRSLPPSVKSWQESMDKVLDDTTHFVEDFIDFARPKLAAGVKTVVRDTSALFNMAPVRLTITRIAADVAGLNPKLYSLSVAGAVSDDASARERVTSKESFSGRLPKEVKTMAFEYGAPLTVQWKAPANHSRKDWIGLYMVTDNRSRDATEVSSLGRWAPTNAGKYDALTADSSIVTPEHCVAKKTDGSEADMVEGEVIFQGDKLWWTQGVFEFRLHHDGNHSVMAISEPFAIRIPPFAAHDDVSLEARAVEAAILPVIQNCLDGDPDIAPSTVDEPFGSHVERDAKYAKRVVYAIREMFGVEFAPAVVLADRTVRKLAWRICNAKEVLAPYSMSHSKGATTPAVQEFADEEA